MISISRRPLLKHRLLIMAYTALMSLVFLSMAFYLTVKKHDDCLTRLALANSILVDQMKLSNVVLQQTMVVSRLVGRGDHSILTLPSERQRQLTLLLARINQSILRKQVLASTAEKSTQQTQRLLEVSRFKELEHLALEALKRSEHIEQLINDDRSQLANVELQTLQGSAYMGRFNALMNDAISQERESIKAIQKSARTLNRVVLVYLPLGGLVAFGVGVVISVVTIRSVDKSVNVLSQAARAYAEGDFSRKVSRLTERELDGLAMIFNQMAERLNESLQKEASQRQMLEKTVALRTRELKQSNDKLARSDRRRARLLSDISHELRTPLTVIQGESELALRTRQCTDEEYRSAITIVREQALHMARMVDDLLFVARSQEGQMSLRKSVVKVDNLVHEVCLDFRVFAKQRKIKIVEKYASKKSTVFADSGRLRQVFSILLDNALRYSVTGGSINVRTRLGDNHVEILVRDDGIGLSEKDLQEVFTRFYRGDLVKRKVDGSGLGLPVAKAIIEAHRGTIELMNNQSRGASAVVRVPLIQEASLTA